jgi:hypothetical protein
MRRWRLVAVLIAVLALGFMFLGFELVHDLNGMGYWEMGIVELDLPSGAAAYVHRQTYGGGPEELYLSENSDYCAPYNSWRDYKLSQVPYRAPQLPLFISYSGDSIVVHGLEKPNAPRFSAPKSFNVEFQLMAPADYLAYARLPAEGAGLPPGWRRIEVTYGHNTCSL